MTPALRWAAIRAILMFHNCEGQSHKTVHRPQLLKRKESRSGFEQRSKPAHWGRKCRSNFNGNNDAPLPLSTHNPPTPPFLYFDYQPFLNNFQRVTCWQSDKNWWKQNYCLLQHLSMVSWNNYKSIQTRTRTSNNKTAAETKAAATTTTTTTTTFSLLGTEINICFKNS